MFSRFIEKAKKTVNVVWQALPGVALLTTRGGGGAFNGFRFAERVQNLPTHKGPKSTLGLVLASINFISVVLVNIYTRFFFMYHQETNKKLSQPPRAKKSRSIKFMPVRLDDADMHLIDNDEKKDNDHLRYLMQTTIGSPIISGDDPLADFEEDEFIEPSNPEPVSTCCYPAIEPRSWHFGYFFMQLISGYYCGGSGTSSIINSDSLIKLLQLWFPIVYNNTCDAHESSPAKLIIVNFLTCLLIWANVKSFLTYNLPALRDYYKNLLIETRLFKEDNTLYAHYSLDNENKLVPIELILRGKRKGKTEFENLISLDGKLYRKNSDGSKERIDYYDGELIAPDDGKLTLHRGLWEISAWNHFETFVGSILGSIAIFYSNQHLTQLFNDTILCHILKLFHKSPIKISESTLLGLASAGATSNFFTTAMMTEGAKYREHKEIREKKFIADLKPTEVKLDDNPNTETKPSSELGYMLPVVKGAIWVNAFNIAQSTYVSVTDLPRAFAGRTDLVNHPAMITMGVFSGLVAIRNTKALDYEGLAREEKRRKNEREAREAKFAETESEEKSVSLSPHRAYSIFASTNNPHMQNQYVQINDQHDSGSDLSWMSDLEDANSDIKLIPASRSGPN